MGRVLDTSIAVLIGSMAWPSLAGTPEPTQQSKLVGNWECSVASVKPEVSANMRWRVTYSPDGRFVSVGGSSFRPKSLAYSIEHEFEQEGSWDLSDGNLLLSPDSVALANATQPAGMSEAETAALREEINEAMRIEDLQQMMLKASSSRIIELSATRLATRDSNNEDIFECRREDAAAPQAR
ncbi:MAG: hypothetical protein ACKOAP_00180 [Vulcanococcus sp.]